MIYKLKGTKNGFVIGEDTTSEDIIGTIQTYPDAKCIICNEVTAKTLELQPITINKGLLNGVFYINGVY